MAVSLYTVRVVLAVLGAEDYGIYNVVAGVVVLFGFVNGAMASGTQRFLNFYLGRGDTERVRETYSASLVIHAIIALVFVVLAETVGLWFVGSKLNIPEGRHGAAMAAYQLATVTSILNILRVPYNAVIIAYERMDFFAYISIIEAVLKLAVVFLLRLGSADRLILYAALLAAVSAAILLAYGLFCKKNFEAARFMRVRNAPLVREMTAFSGWSLFGAAANVSCSQGTNIVLNVFTNVTVNAAMGIANQVNAAVYSFVSNFQTAFNPQIVKSWAAGDGEGFRRLLIRSSKYSFFLLWLIVLPLYVNADIVLLLWLGEVPEYAVQFVRLTLVWSLIESINGLLYMAINAAGRIKLYQIIIGCINILNVPLTIFAFSLGFAPEWLLYIRIGVNVIALGFRVVFCRRMVCLPVQQFFAESVFRPLLIVFVSSAMTIIAEKNIQGPYVSLFITSIVSLVSTSLLVFFVGMGRSERISVFARISGKFR